MMRQLAKDQRGMVSLTSELAAAPGDGKGAGKARAVKGKAKTAARVLAISSTLQFAEEKDCYFSHVPTTKDVKDKLVKPEPRASSPSAA